MRYLMPSFTTSVHFLLQNVFSSLSFRLRYAFGLRQENLRKIFGYGVRGMPQAYQVIFGANLES